MRPYLWHIRDVGHAIREATEMDHAMARLRKTLGVSAQEAQDRLHAAIGRAVTDGRHWSMFLDDVTPPTTPSQAQPHSSRPGGLSQAATTPLRKLAAGPVLPHSAEQKESTVPGEFTPPEAEATPEQRRSAWLALVAELEGIVLARRTAARTRWELGAQAWAADRLLGQLTALPAPVVPLDPEKGQGTILELFPGMAEAVAQPLDRAVLTGESTAVENSVEEDHPPCCQSCEGLGGDSSGPCWDCRGTGHAHPLGPTEEELPAMCQPCPLRQDGRARCERLDCAGRKPFFVTP